MTRATAALLLLLAAAGSVTAAAAAGDGPPKVYPRTEDLPFIRCQVCELLAKHAWKQAKEVLKTASPTNKVDEMMLIERVEKMGTAWRPEGEWIAQLDLVEQGDRLVVKEMGQLGTCGVECKTVERAVEDVIGEHDTDMAEALFVGKRNRAQFSNWLCYELTGACSAKPPPLPKGRAPGPAFEVRQAGEQDLDRMMGEMQDQGLKGSLYSREQLMAKYGMQEGDDEDEGESEGDEAAAPGRRPPPHGGPRVPRSMEQAVQRVRWAVGRARWALEDAMASARQRLAAAAVVSRKVAAKVWAAQLGRDWEEAPRQKEEL